MSKETERLAKENERWSADLAALEERLRKAIERVAPMDGIKLGKVPIDHSPTYWTELMAPMKEYGSSLQLHAELEESDQQRGTFHVLFTLRVSRSPLTKPRNAHPPYAIQELETEVKAAEKLDPAFLVPYLKGAFAAIILSERWKTKTKELEEQVKKLQAEVCRPHPFDRFGPMGPPYWR